MESGHLALVCYGEVPLVWHARLLLAPTTGSSWIILTPDLDRYEELLDPSNSDYTGFEYLGDNPAIPAHIPQRSVYGFAPMDPGFVATQVRQARIEANVIRAGLGLPALAAGMGAHVPAPPPQAPVAPPLPPGVLGAASWWGACSASCLATRGSSVCLGCD